MFQISKELVCQNEREEEITSEKDMVENCENEPKLNGKMKCKEIMCVRACVAEPSMLLSALVDNHSLRWSLQPLPLLSPPCKALKKWREAREAR